MMAVKTAAERDRVCMMIDLLIRVYRVQYSKQDKRVQSIGADAVCTKREEILRKRVLILLQLVLERWKKVRHSYWIRTHTI